MRLTSRLACLALAAPAALAQPCQPEWSDGFRFHGLDTATALVSWPTQDPERPLLAAAGWFSDAGVSLGKRVGVWSGEHWDTLGAAPNDYIFSLAAFDEDGDGPAPSVLYCGGWFNEFDGKPALGVARWNGNEWSQAGGGLPNGVFALCTFDADGDGPGPAVLVAGGDFNDYGGLSGVAAFDGGFFWQPLGGGITAGGVRCLLSWDDDGDGRPSLFAGGWFKEAGGQPASAIARWDGKQWSALGDGLDSTVFALAVFDEDGDGPGGPALFAGGQFDESGDEPAYRIARWDGAAWTNVGGGITGQSVRSLATYDDDGDGPLPPALYVGGTLWGSAKGVYSPGCIRWSGQEWSAMETTLPAEGQGFGDTVVNTMLAFDFDGPGPQRDLLCAGGSLAASADASDGLGLWDGAEWTLLSKGVNDQPSYLFGVQVLIPMRHGTPSLLVGGDFAWHALTLDASGVHPFGADPCCAYWFNQLWYWVRISAAAWWDDDGPGPHPEALYIGGNFDSLKNTGGTSGLARLDESGWSSIGFNDTRVNAIAVFDPDGEGPDSGALFVTGDLHDREGRIAAWDGQQWSALSSGLGGLYDPHGDALAAFDPDGDGPEAQMLIVGGQFLTAGGLPVMHIAAWDGQAWSALGDGLGADGSAFVRALCVFDPDGAGPEPGLLIAGGRFSVSGNTALANIAAWDGAAWQPLGPGLDGTVSALAVHDEDGAGPRPPALYAGGGFSHAGETPVSNIARWDGAAWTALSAGIDGGVRALASFDEDGDGPLPPALYVGGRFHAAGGLRSDLIARWGCPSPRPCPADCDASGALDLFDFLCFVNLYNSHDPAADCTADGDFDFFDFVCFINLFNNGC